MALRSMPAAYVPSRNSEVARQAPSGAGSKSCFEAICRQTLRGARNQSKSHTTPAATREMLSTGVLVLALSFLFVLAISAASAIRSGSPHHLQSGDSHPAASCQSSTSNSGPASTGKARARDCADCIRLRSLPPHRNASWQINSLALCCCTLPHLRRKILFTGYFIAALHTVEVHTKMTRCIRPCGPAVYSPVLTLNEASMLYLTVICIHFARSLPPQDTTSSITPRQPRGRRRICHSTSPGVRQSVCGPPLSNRAVTAPSSG